MAFNRIFASLCRFSEARESELLTPWRAMAVGIFVECSETLAETAPSLSSGASKSVAGRQQRKRIALTRFAEPLRSRAGQMSRCSPAFTYTRNDAYPSALANQLSYYRSLSRFIVRGVLPAPSCEASDRRLWRSLNRRSAYMSTLDHTLKPEATVRRLEMISGRDDVANFPRMTRLG